MDELTKMIMKHVNAATTRLDSLQGDTKVRSINISIDRGYGVGDPWLVKYQISEGYSGDKAEGADFHAVVVEFLRRKGWTEANKPMVLIKAQKEEEQEHGTFVVSIGETRKRSDDDVPF